MDQYNPSDFKKEVDQAKGRDVSTFEDAPQNQKPVEENTQAAETPAIDNAKYVVDYEEDNSSMTYSADEFKQMHGDIHRDNSSAIAYRATDFPLNNGDFTYNENGTYRINYSDGSHSDYDGKLFGEYIHDLYEDDPTITVQELERVDLDRMDAMDLAEGIEAARKSGDRKKIKELKEAYYNNPYVLQQRQLKADEIDSSLHDIDEVSAQVSAIDSAQRYGYNAPGGAESADRRIQDASARYEELTGVKYNATDGANYLTARRLLDNAYKTITAPGKYEDTSGISDLFKGAGDKLKDATFWDSGLMAIMDNLQVRDVFRKMQDEFGKVDFDKVDDESIVEVLSPSERALVDAFAKNLAAQSERAEDMSRGYNAGLQATESMKFMAEFMLTGGIGKGASEAATKGVKKLTSYLAKRAGLNSATKAVSRTVTRAGLRTIGKGATEAAAKGAAKLGSFATTNLKELGQMAVKSTAQAAIMPSSYKTITDQLTVIDDAGQLQDAGAAIWTGMKDAWIEAFSENAGEILQKAMDSPIKYVWKDWGRLSKLSVPGVLKEAGFHGYFGEIAEEFLGAFMRTATNTDPDAWKDFTKWDNLLTTAISFAPMSIFGMSVSTVQMGKLRHDLTGAEKSLRESLLSKGYTEETIENIIGAVNGATNVEEISRPISSLISDMVRQGNTVLDESTVSPILEYANAAARWHAAEGRLELDNEQKRKDLEASISGTVSHVGADGQTNGRFWQEATDKDGKTHRLVREIRQSDGSSWYVLSSDDSGKVIYVNGQGQLRYSTEADIEKGVATGSMTDYGAMEMDDYLDTALARDDKAVEQRRMSSDAMAKRKALMDSVNTGDEINVSTTEVPENVTVIQKTNDGMVVQAADGSTYNLVWEEYAKGIGQSLEAQTDDQISADMSETELNARRMRYEANRKGVGAQFTHNGTEYSFVKMGLGFMKGNKLSHWVIAQDASGRTVGIEASDDELAPVYDQVAALTAAIGSQLDSESEGTTGQPSLEQEPDTVLNGEQLPTMVNKKGETVVDQTALWNNDPRKWAEWNDRRKQDGGADSIIYIRTMAAALDKQITDVRNRYNAETNPDRRDEILDELTPLEERRAVLQTLLDEYQRRADEAKAEQERIAKEAEEQQKKDEERRRILDEIQARAKEIGERISKMKTKDVQYHVYTNANDIPTDAGRSAMIKNLRNGAAAYGWTTESKDGISHVHIFAPSYVGDEHWEDELAKTILHELIQHVGVKRFLGDEEFRRVMNLVWEDMMDKASRNTFSEYVWNANYSEAQRRGILRDAGKKEWAELSRQEKNAVMRNASFTADAADEYSAMLIQDEGLKEMNWFQRLWEAIKNLFKKGGFEIGDTITIDDLAKLWSLSENNLRREQAARQNIETQEAKFRATNQNPLIGRSLTHEEADSMIAQMESSAEEARVLELTPENWNNEFGEDGVVNTPVGDVKIGANQLIKLINKNRTEYLGLIRPTLESPDIILEEHDPKEGASRDTKYLFIKTFIKADGSRLIHFESVTVRKDNLEISISSHELESGAIKKKMQDDKVLHLNPKLSLSSERRLAETPEERPDLVPTPDSYMSAANVANNSENANEEAKSHKEAQLDIILNSNPAEDDYHTWIRTVEDIKSFDEVLEDAEKMYGEYGGLTYPDMSIEDLRKAKESGEITVYSSKPIENGAFVTPSRMNAQDYAGGGEVYEATVPVEDVAWVGEDEGQMAHVRFRVMSDEESASVLSEIQNKTTAIQSEESDDNNVRFSIGRKRRSEMETRLDKKRPDLTEEQKNALFSYLDGLDDTKSETAVFNWFVRGRVNIPEDNYKIEEALDIIKAHPGLDVQRYASPMDVIDEFREPEEEEVTFDPTTLDYLSNPKTIGDVTIYEMEDSEDAAKHFCENVMQKFYETSPWCLMAWGNHGEWIGQEMWNHYNKVGRRVAFDEDGKPVAFMSSSDRKVTWWDETDAPHSGVPVSLPMEGDELGRSAIYEVNEKTGKRGDITAIFKGSKKEGLYEEWYTMHPDIKKLSSTKKHHKLQGQYMTWNLSGHIQEVAEYRNGLLEHLELYYDNGRLAARSEYKNGQLDGMHETWYENGARYFSGAYKDGRREGTHTRWLQSGRMSTRSTYKGGESIGLSERWHEDGTPAFRAFYNDRHKLEGPLEEWYENGNLMNRENFDSDGKHHGSSEYWRSDGRLEGRDIYNHGVRVIRELYKGEAGKEQLTRRTHYDEKGREHGRRQDWDWDGNLTHDFIMEHGVYKEPTPADYDDHDDEVVRFRFIGTEGARREDISEDSFHRTQNLSTAEMMEESGKDAKAIKMATGWERGKDGQWRYEEPDGRLTENWEKARTLEKLIDDPKLFEAYPSLRKVKVGKERGRGSWGSFAPNENTLRINVTLYKKFVDSFNDELANPSHYSESTRKITEKILQGKTPEEWMQRKLRGTVVHEIQHAIQKEEGFATGGDANSVISQLLLDRFGQEYADLRKASMHKKNLGTLTNLMNTMAYRPLNMKRLDGQTKREFLRNQLDSFVSMTHPQTGSAWQSFLENVDNGDQIDIQTGRDALAELYRMNVTDLMSKVDEKAISDYRAELEKVGADELYRRLAGETEARNVEERMDMDEETRSNTLASETEDRSRENQIVLYENPLNGAELEMLDGMGTDTFTPAENESTFDETENATEPSGEPGLSNGALAVKETTGYKTPQEKLESNVRFALRTVPDWAISYMAADNSERSKEIVRIISSWYNRIAADGAVRAAISPSFAEYSKASGLNKDGIGPLRGNVEYRFTFDVDTTCPRTMAFLSMSEYARKLLSRPMTIDEAQNLIEVMRANGLEIPCVYCYAENKRQALSEAFLTYIKSRQAVITAKSEDEAFRAMYGHKKADDPSSALNKPSVEVLAEWRSGKGLATYNPSIEELYDDYGKARKRVFYMLDLAYRNGEINADMSDKGLAKYVCRNVLKEEDESYAKSVESEVRDICNEWRYDVIEQLAQPGVGTVLHRDVMGREAKELDYALGFKNTAKTLALWNQMTKYGKSSSSAHNSVRYIPYTNELKDPDVVKERDTINAMGGFRLHSSNDFRIDYVGEYLQFFADLAQGEWMSHSYSKSPLYVELFGNTGARINMSIAAYDVDGEVVENQNEGHVWATAMDLRKKFPNAGTMFMTTSSAQLQYALDADWVDMIIPFHSSGLPKRVWYDMRAWEDAQATQNEAYYNSDDKKEMLKGMEYTQEDLDYMAGVLRGVNKLSKAQAEKVNGGNLTIEDALDIFIKKASAEDINTLYDRKRPHKSIVTYEQGEQKRVRPHFLPGESRVKVKDKDGNKIEVAVPGWYIPGASNEENIANYMRLCEEYGVHPRFHGIMVKDAQGNEIPVEQHPGYIKLIKEAARIDTPQEVVKFNLDEPTEGLYSIMVDENGDITGDSVKGQFVDVNPKTGKGWSAMDYAEYKLKEFAHQGGYETNNLDGQKKYLVEKFIKEYVGKPLGYLSEDDRASFNALWKKNVYDTKGNLVSSGEFGEDNIPYHAKTQDATIEESEANVRMRRVIDPFKVAELESGPKITVYRAMALIDGVLYPPMASKEDGRLKEGIRLGQWAEAEEHLDKATWEEGKAYASMKITKPNNKSLTVAYNPYVHSSYSMLNDQFAEAQSRPEVVVVETQVPASELTSGYHAEGAKDSVGEVAWKSGVVSNKLPAGKKRVVVLSRWAKPVRIVPYSEVAQNVAQQFEGIDVSFPSNVLHPELRSELENLGFEVYDTDNKGKRVSAENVKFRFAKNEDEFSNIQKEAVARNGIVTPGLRDMSVDILNLENHPFSGDNIIGQAKTWAEENGIIGEHTLSNGDRYEISKKAVKKYLSESANAKSDNLGIQIAALMRLPEIIDGSIDAEVHPDYKKDADGKRGAENGIGRSDLLIHRLYGAITNGGELYRVKTTMYEYSPVGKKSNAPHSYEVTKIEVLGKPNTSTSGDQEVQSTNETDRLSAAKLLNGIEKSYDSGKKLLDESRDVKFRTVSWEDLSNAENQKALAEEIRDALIAEGIADHFSLSTSETNFGTSTYVQNLALGVKIRISDHDVSRMDRIFDEIHVRKGNTVASIVATAKERADRIRDIEKAREDQWQRVQDRRAAADEKWERIKGIFAGLRFHRMARTWQTFDEFMEKHPDAKYVMQAAPDGRGGASVRGGMHSYEYALPERRNDLSGYVKPSIPFIESYNEEDDSVETTRFRTVYHGTVADFNRFDHSHMGEGEGYQAYGWGTYVTEDEGTGRYYATANAREMEDDLIPDEEQSKVFELQTELANLEKQAGEYYRQARWAKISANEYRRIPEVVELHEKIDAKEKEINDLYDGLREKYLAGHRHLYTVDVPEDNGSNYIHWDKDYSYEEMRDILSRLTWRDPSNPDRSFARKIHKEFPNEEGMTGEEFMRHLGMALDGDPTPGKNTSEALASIGFVGVSYPADNFNGGREDNARNYVIFNEDDARITDHIRFRAASYEGSASQMRDIAEHVSGILGVEADGRYFSTHDATVSLLNKAVADKGLETVLGDGYAKATLGIFHDLTYDERSEVFNKYAIPNGVRIDRGVEEWLAEKVKDEQINIRFHATYHGSGSEFDAFDHSHMGEGEGNQAFGWGTYVTESEGIGKYYANMMSKGNRNNNLEIKVKENGVWNTYKYEPSDGQNNSTRIVSMAYDLLQSYPSIAEAKAKAERFVDLAEDEEMKEAWQSVIDFLEGHRKSDFKASTPRVLYSVDIPEDNGHNYLHWEKHFESDPTRFKEALERRGFKEVVDPIGTYYEKEGAMSVQPASATSGEWFYKELVKSLGSKKEASKVLSEAGYVGISYPAEYSTRGLENNARNYVIFNEDDARITDHVRFRTSPVWSNAASHLSDALKDKDINAHLSESEAKWLVWQSANKNRKNDIISMAERRVIEDNLGFSPETRRALEFAEDKLRFRLSNDKSITSAAALYDMAVMDARNRLSETWIDQFQSVNDLIEAIERVTGKKAQSFEDVRLALNQQSSKGLEEMNKWQRKYWNPLVRIMKQLSDKYGLTTEQIERYVMLKHGIERNEVFAQRDAIDHYAQERDARIRDIRNNDNLSDGEKQTEIDKANDTYDNHVKDVKAKADPIYAANRERDYSGLTGMFTEYDASVVRTDFRTDAEYEKARKQSAKSKYKKVEDMEKAAQKEIDDIESNVGTMADDLWTAINNATKSTLKHQYDANMLSRDQYESIRDMFKYYVPLRGFSENTDADIYDYYTTNVGSPYTKPVQHAKGRKTQADSPFGVIGQMASSAISQDIKNNTRLALWYFVNNRKDQDAIFLGDVWYRDTGTVDSDGRKVWEEARYPFNENLEGDAAKQAYEDWEDQMKDLQKQGLAMRGGDMKKLDYVIQKSKGDFNEHQIRVRVGGREKVMYINGNPRAAQAINGLLNYEANKTGFEDILGHVLRYMSGVSTQYNPEFWISNFQRDLLFSMMSVNVKDGNKATAQFLANLRKSMKVIKMLRDNKNGTLGNSALEQHYRDFAENGGITGYTVVNDNDYWEDELKKSIKGHNKAGELIRDVGESIMDFGEAIEQMTRFAAYLTARENGKNIIDSVADAKELTVNFNRKGSGKTITPEEAKNLNVKGGWAGRALLIALSAPSQYGRGAVMFFNAAVQGVNALFRLFKANKVKTLAWMTGYFMLGAINALLHSMFDDDDDYLDMPAHERRTNFLLRVGRGESGKGVYLSWALPQESRMFFGMGDLFVNKLIGREPHTNGAWEAVEMVTDIAPINPMGGWRAVIPSYLTPFFDLHENETFSGSPIAKIDKYASKSKNENTPEYLKVYPGTNSVLVDISEFLNGVGGGDETQKGRYWINDVNPAKVEHFIESYTGGTGKTISNIWKSTIGLALGGEWTVRNTPFLRRLMKVNDERFQNSYAKDVYYFYSDEAENYKRRIKEYDKSIKTAKDAKDEKSLLDYETRKSNLEHSDANVIYDVFTIYEPIFKDIDKAIKNDDGTLEKELTNMRDETRKLLIKDISESLQKETLIVDEDVLNFYKSKKKKSRKK